MSCWTHITACFSVETGMIAKNAILKRRVRSILKHAPKITGSEGDASIFINIQEGHNWSMSRDCEHCKYRDTLRDVVIDGEEGQTCDGPDDYDCSAEYQSCIVISIQGDLRDRMKPETQKEFEDFKSFLEKRFYVRDYSVNIEGD